MTIVSRAPSITWQVKCLITSTLENTKLALLFWLFPLDSTQCAHVSLVLESLELDRVLQMASPVPSRNLYWNKQMNKKNQIKTHNEIEQPPKHTPPRAGMGGGTQAKQLSCTGTHRNRHNSSHQCSQPVAGGREWEGGTSQYRSQTKLVWASCSKSVPHYLGSLPFLCSSHSCPGSGPCRAPTHPHHGGPCIHLSLYTDDIHETIPKSWRYRIPRSV